VWCACAYVCVRVRVLVLQQKTTAHIGLETICPYYIQPVTQCPSEYLSNSHDHTLTVTQHL
jgi:hypothetical protein